MTADYLGELTACPECSGPAQLTDRALLDSTDGPVEHAHIRFGIKTVAALRALGRDQAEGFPGTQRRRRNTDAVRHFADAQAAMRPLPR